MFKEGWVASTHHNEVITIVNDVHAIAGPMWPL